MTATDTTRWRLHRGGIVNIWAYGERTFDLSGGRAILQGANGSGKSRTLELLLPLCLDGDLRQLGCKGFDTVSMRRLLLDEYSGGASRVGYAWIELRRTAGGVEEFLTCGVGVKASVTSQQITDSWRFVTPLRVGPALRLAPDGVPLGPAALREAIGPDRVYPEAAFRARVAELVYGMPAGRYGDLLHLQRTLRNPDVGLKVLEGQLEQILSDALPPLDRALLDRLAGSFEDLDAIRDSIAGLAAADQAFESFVGAYSGYARERLRAADEELRAAEESVRAGEREHESFAAELATSREERRRAESERDERQSEEDGCEERLLALRELPAYHDLEDARGRERLVSSARSLAVASLDAAGRQRAAEETAVAGVSRAVRRLSADLSAAAEPREDLRAQLAAAGMDIRTLPELPEAPGDAGVPAEPAAGAWVRESPEPDAAPVEVVRPAAPACDIDAVAAAVERSVAAAEAVAGAAGERVSLATSLVARIEELDARGEELRRTQASTKDAQVAATEATALRHQATQELWTAADIWLERVREWRGHGPDTVGEPELPRAEALLDGMAAATDVEAAARAWIDRPLRAADDRVAELTAEYQDVAREIGVRERELATVRAGRDAEPEPPWFADRPGAGQRRRLYELVDFADGMSDADRAGIEAALQSSGLLVAAVSESGTLPERPDVCARAAEPHTPSLAAVLVPAVRPDSPVPEAAVAAVLASIGLVDDPPATGAHTAVSTSGAWRCGALAGHWSKPAAEFLGAGARALARERRAAALAEELEELAGSRADVEKRLDAARSEARGYREHAERFPSTAELLAAHAKVAAQSEAAGRAGERAAGLRERYDAEHARGRAARADAERDAADAGMPAEAAALREARQSAVDARRAAASLRQVLRGGVAATLAELREAAEHARGATAERESAEERAEADCRDYAHQRSALDSARASVGDEAEEIRRSIAELEEARKRARAERARAGERVTRARERAAKLEARVEAAAGTLDGRREAAEDARRRFAERVHAPGILTAAFGAGTAEMPVADAATAEVLDVVRSRLAADDAPAARGTGESAVLAKVQALQSALAGSHDVVAERRAGVLAVTVAGESGTRPVADAAREVAATLAAQRGFLDERYQTIFADYLISDLTERLRAQIAIADDLTRRMNEVLDGARSSQGVRVQLSWRPSAALDEPTRDALELLRTPYVDRTPEQNARVRAMFTERIESERDSGGGGYGDVLARALDYRSWHAFSVKVADTGPDGKPRQRRLRQLSSGETRLVSYVTLFAAAAAFYDAVGVEAGDGAAGPLRLVLLDEAFERLDDPTVARLLGLLVDLDMDWMITWPSGWGVSEKIPRMHIYDILRARTGGGIACVQTTWDGTATARSENP